MRAKAYYICTISAFFLVISSPGLMPHLFLTGFIFMVLQDRFFFFFWRASKIIIWELICPFPVSFSCLFFPGNTRWFFRVIHPIYQGYMVRVWGQTAWVPVLAVIYQLGTFEQEANCPRPQLLRLQNGDDNYIYLIKSFVRQGFFQILFTMTHSKKHIENGSPVDM